MALDDAGDVAGAVLVELVGVAVASLWRGVKNRGGRERRGLAKDDDCDVDGAEDTELVRLFEEAGLALGKK